MTEISSIASKRFTFEDVYLAYEGAPISENSGETDFVSIFKESDFEGEWLVSTKLESTLLVAGYPANVYKCRAERVGYLKFPDCSTVLTTVGGSQRNVMISVEVAVEMGDVQAAQWLYPCSDGWQPIDQWLRFGPNGKQVIALIEWLRDCLSRPEAAIIIKQLHGYKDRARLTWPRYPYVAYSFPPALNLPAIKYSWQPWKRGRALVRAWHEAMEVAATKGMWWPVSYVAAGGPGFVAVALRHLISAEAFRELYAVLEPLHPLGDLDAKAAFQDCSADPNSD